MFSSAPPLPEKSIPSASSPPAFRFPNLLALSLGILLAGCAAYGPPRAGESIYRNLVFASPGGRDLRLDLYVPRTSQPAPVVIWIFGGSWRIGYKGYHLNLRDLPKYGIALAAIDYRYSQTARYPAQIEDCEAAATWLRANGARYGINPQRIGASGESAGGHLAALLGTIEGTPRIRAVCALYPPTDLVALGRMYASPKRPSDIDRLLGVPTVEHLDLAEEASPIDHVSRTSPPFLIIHGADDTLVPLAQSQELHRRLLKAGVQSRLVVVPGKGHWFLLSPDQVSQVAGFFERHFAAIPSAGPSAKPEDRGRLGETRAPERRGALGPRQASSGD